MHIHLLSIPFLPIHYRRNKHQRIFGNEIPYASFFPGVCCYIELEGTGEGYEGKGEEGKEDGLTCHQERDSRTVENG